MARKCQGRRESNSLLIAEARGRQRDFVRADEPCATATDGRLFIPDFSFLNAL